MVHVPNCYNHATQDLSFDEEQFLPASKIRILKSSISGLHVFS
jgi:hypothetical protein